VDSKVLSFKGERHVLLLAIPLRHIHKRRIFEIFSRESYWVLQPMESVY
jgi:hypothetical protein